MRIRPAIEADLPQLLLLIEALSAEERNSGLAGMTPGLLRVQAFRRTPPAFSCVVAEHEAGALVGFASYWLIPAARGEESTVRILGIFVKSPMRRRHIGERLMRAVARTALENKYESVAWSTNDCQPAARSFSAWLCGPNGTASGQSRLTIDTLNALAGTPADESVDG